MLINEYIFRDWSVYLRFTIFFAIDEWVLARFDNDWNLASKRMSIEYHFIAYKD